MLMPRIKRRPGAQPGNQNARKHGYYAKNFSPTALASLPTSHKALALDDEIFLLRLTLVSLKKYASPDSPLIVRTVNCLRRMVADRHRNLDRDDRKTRDLYRSFVKWLAQSRPTASPAVFTSPPGEAGLSSAPAKTTRACSS
jgi:hypothetical protein